MSKDTAGLHPIDALGTSERTWTTWPWLSAPPGTRAPATGSSGLARHAGLAQVASAVIVAAHPDDEVLGAGGLMSMLATARARLRLVAVTDGEGSHRGHADPGELARRRTAETTAALRALGAPAAEVIRLRLPDTGLAGREDDLTAALAPLAEGFDICLAPWDRDMHPDHEAAGRAACRAAPGRRTTTPSGCGTGLVPPTRGCPGTVRCASRCRRMPPRPSGPRSAASPARPGTGATTWARCSPPR